MERGLNLFCVRVKLLLVHDGRLPDLCHDGTLVTYGLDDIACSGFSLCANKRGAFGDPAEGLTKVSCTADKRDFEAVFIDMVLLVRGSEDLGFIDIIYADGLEDL